MDEKGNTKVFDTHVHLDVIDEHIPENELVLSVGYKDDVNRILPMIAGQKGIPFSVGIAPQVAMYEKFIENHSWIQNIMEIINNNKCAAIGEIGLDYKWAVTDDDKKRQLEWLTVQLKIAEAHNLPVIIHSRKAENELVDLLSSWKLDLVFHSFTGKVNTAQKIIDHGWKIGVTPLKSRDKKKVISLGIENLVVETDAPYIGKKFEDINESIERIREVTGLPTGDIIKVTFDNGIKLFKLEGRL